MGTGLTKDQKERKKKLFKDLLNKKAITIAMIKDLEKEGSPGIVSHRVVQTSKESFVSIKLIYDDYLNIAKMLHEEFGVDPLTFNRKYKLTVRFMGEETHGKRVQGLNAVITNGSRLRRIIKISDVDMNWGPEKEEKYNNASEEERKEMIPSLIREEHDKGTEFVRETFKRTFRTFYSKAYGDEPIRVSNVDTYYVFDYRFLVQEFNKQGSKNTLIYKDNYGAEYYHRNMRNTHGDLTECSIKNYNPEVIARIKQREKESNESLKNMFNEELMPWLSRDGSNDIDDEETTVSTRLVDPEIKEDKDGQLGLYPIE